MNDAAGEGTHGPQLPAGEPREGGVGVGEGGGGRQQLHGNGNISGIETALGEAIG